MNNEIDSTISLIDSLRSLEIINMYSILNAIVPANTYESFYKSYYQIALKKINEEVLNSQEYNLLYSLSRLCPKSYGNLTYIANANLVEGDRLESLTANCTAPALLGTEENKNSSSLCEVSLYPNPLTKLNDLYIHSKCIVVNCRVFNIYGKELKLNNELIDSININILRTSKLNLDSGVYFVVVSLANGSSIQKKILIN